MKIECTKREFEILIRALRNSASCDSEINEDSPDFEYYNLLVNLQNDLIEKIRKN